MSDRLQSGLHPDAEVLSAFAEGALPAHERTHTLAHLAGCASCREIVFLAQQAAPQPVAPTLSFLRRYRHSITLFGTALGLPALACLLIFFVTLRPHPTAATTESAHVHPPTPPAPASAPAPPSTTPKPSPPASALKIEGFSPYERADKKHEALAPPRVPRPPATPLPPLIAAVPRPMVAPRGFMGMGMAAGVGRAPTVGAAAPVRSMSLRSSQADGVRQAAGQLTVAAPQPTSITLGNGLSGLHASKAANAPVPPPSAAAMDALAEPPAAPSSVSESVEVTSATQSLSMDSASLSTTLPNVAPAKKRTLAPEPLSGLPSHLPTTWLISAGPRTLAADTAGALFFSPDAGLHWKAVATTWPGKVARLKLAPPPSVFQLITTTGDVWLSADGLHWQPQ